jgi:hypothetical protein
MSLFPSKFVLARIVQATEKKEIVQYCRDQKRQEKAVLELW